MNNDFEGMFEESTALAEFNRNYLAQFKQLQELASAKKSLEAEEKRIKAEIELAMQDKGITSLSNDYVSISYIAPTESYKLDEKAFKQDDYDLYEECLAKYNKRTAKKGYVRIIAKGEK